MRIERRRPSADELQKGEVGEDKLGQFKSTNGGGSGHSDNRKQS